MTSGCGSAYRRLSGPETLEGATDGDISAHGANGAFELTVLGPAEHGGPGLAARPRAVLIRAAMVFFIVGIAIPCLSLGLGTMQCITIMQWLPGEHPAAACSGQPAMCLLLGLTVSGISMGVHGFLWVLQLLWPHV
jgi:hypothetical protein